MAVQADHEDAWAVLAEVSVEVAGSLSLESILRTVVDAARRLSGARYAALGVLGTDGRIARFVTSGLSAEAEHELGKPPTGRGILGVMIDEGRPLRLDDLRTDPRSAGFPAGHPPMRSFLGLPILAQGQIFGNLYLTEAPGGRFTEADERIMRLLAAQAGVAVQNARLYEESVRQGEQARRSAQVRLSLTGVAATIMRERDVTRVLDALAADALELVEADSVGIGVLDEPAGLVRFASAAGTGADSLAGREIPVEGTLPGTVIRARSGLRIDAIGSDVAQQAGVAHPVGSLLAAPLVLDDRAVAVILATHPLEDSFDEEDEELLEAFAALGAVAYQTARAFSRERERSEALAEVRSAEAAAEVRRSALAQVAVTEERERRRIAQDLHDRTAGSLASITFALSRLERDAQTPELRSRLHEVREDVAATIEDLRDLIADLRPKVLDDFGLEPALERLCQTVARRGSLEVRCTPLGDGPVITGELATTAYRIVQESLANVVRHARARVVAVSAGVVGPKLIIEVADDGIGITSRGDGYGISGMQERAALVHGTLELGRSELGGVLVRFEAPL